LLLFYVTPTPPGVSETFITDEAAHMRNLGLDIFMFALNPMNGVARRSSPRQLAAVLRSFGRLASRRPHGAAQFLFWWWRFRDLPNWLVVRSVELAEALVRERPDRVHVHFVDQTAVAALLACKLAGLPMTVTAHARDIFFSPEHWFPLFNRTGIRFVAVCQYNLLELAKRGVDADHIAVIPCGADIDATAPMRDGSLAGRARVLVVGRLVAKKGIDDLLLAVQDESVAEAVEEIRIIGDGPERRTLEKIAQGAARAGVKVVFLGAVPRPQHVQHYRWANLACLPCKIGPDGDRDSMPVAIKEALVAGLPVLTTDEVGIPEMVDKTTAMMVPPDSPDDLGRQLVAYSTWSAGDRERLASAGAARVRSRFDLHLTVRALRDYLFEDTMPSMWNRMLSVPRQGDTDPRATL
jgi:glycosyltransferase involved in cell wall biosynthesis